MERPEEQIAKTLVAEYYDDWTNNFKELLISTHMRAYLLGKLSMYKPKNKNKNENNKKNNQLS